MTTANAPSSHERHGPQSAGDTGRQRRRVTCARTIWVSAAIFALSGSSSSYATDGGSTDALTARLAAEVSRVFKADAPGAAVIVVKDGRTILREGVGMANLELGVPVRPDMIFRLGSVTKQFTAVAVLMLMEQGKLALTDEVIKFLPDYPTHGQRITIENLLTHTSGIKNYTDLPEFWAQQRADRSPAELISLFRDLPLDFPPGERWNYSNSGYAVLGEIIEVVSGQSYGEFIEKNIFSPLAMTHSSFDRTGKVIAGRVPGYKRVGTELVNADYMSMTLPYAAGSLLSSVDDMEKWDAALYSERLVKQSSLERAWTSAHLNDGRLTNYGFGWMTLSIEGLRMVAHRGGVNGFSCMSVRVRDVPVYAAVLTNREGGEGNLAVKLAVLASGGEWHEPVGVALPPDALDQFTGTYRLNGSDVINVTRKGAVLFAALPHFGNLELLPVSQSEFVFVADPLARIAFQGAGSAGVTLLTLKSGRGPDEQANRELPPKPPASQ